MSFTCPKCRMTSYNVNDALWGYCGNCHEFTGGYMYGQQRHCSSSLEAEPDRPMQLRQESEEGQAKMSKMQGNGKNYSIWELRGGRMDQQQQQGMQGMRGNGLPVKPEYPPSVFRFYFGAIAVGMVWGITWTLAVMRFIHSPYNYQALYGFAALIFVWQIIHLVRENKRLKIVRAALDKDWEDLKRKYPEMQDLEQYKVMVEERKRPH